MTCIFLNFDRASDLKTAKIWHRKMCLAPVDKKIDKIESLYRVFGNPLSKIYRAVYSSTKSTRKPRKWFSTLASCWVVTTDFVVVKLWICVVVHKCSYAREDTNARGRARVSSDARRYTRRYYMWLYVWYTVILCIMNGTEISVEMPSVRTCWHTSTKSNYKNAQKFFTYFGHLIFFCSEFKLVRFTFHENWVFF